MRIKIKTIQFVFFLWMWKLLKVLNTQPKILSNIHISHTSDCRLLKGKQLRSDRWVVLQINEAQWNLLTALSLPLSLRKSFPENKQWKVKLPPQLMEPQQQLCYRSQLYTTVSLEATLTAATLLSHCLWRSVKMIPCRWVWCRHTLWRAAVLHKQPLTHGPYCVQGKVQEHALLPLLRLRLLRVISL